MADDTTYGPSEDRRGVHAPIRFKKGVKTNSGRDAAAVYRLEPQTLLDALTQKFKDQIPGSIEVDPTASNDVGQTIRHEGVHALLNKNNIDLTKLNSENPEFSRIASVFPSSLGDPNQEVPALAATGELTRMYNSPVPQNWMDAYTDHLKRQLFTLNPDLGRMYASYQGAQPNAGNNGPQ